MLVYSSRIFLIITFPNLHFTYFPPTHSLLLALKLLPFLSVSLSLSLSFFLSVPLCPLPHFPKKHNTQDSLDLAITQSLLLSLSLSLRHPPYFIRNHN